jgi:hypothetical protein
MSYPVNDWLQVGAIVATGLYAIFRIGRYFQAQASEIKSLKHRMDNIERRVNNLDERCIEQHREHGP